MGEVVSLENMRPKTMRRRYRQTDFVLTYLPAAKEWQYEITYVQVSKFYGTAKTSTRAQKEAEKHIDNTLQIRGVK